MYPAVWSDSEHIKDIGPINFKAGMSFSRLQQQEKSISICVDHHQYHGVVYQNRYY